MQNDRFEDDEIVESGEDIVRGFMATGGRARARAGTELPAEALLSLASGATQRLPELQFERHTIVAGLSGHTSVAEVAAHLGLPVRAAIVIATEMVAEGLLVAEDVVRELDLPMLQQIRSKILSL